MPLLDDLDRRLISLLRANGREPVSSLADRLGVTRATVTSRMARLVDSGVIVGYSVRVRDPAEATVVRAISLLAVEGRNVNRVVQALRGIPEIAAVHSTNGRWDLIAELSCDSLASFDDALGMIRRIEGVHTSETCLLLSTAL